MKKLLLISSFILHSFILLAQSPMASIKVDGNFGYKGAARGYFNNYTDKITVNTFIDNQISRQLFDSSFQLLASYTSAEKGLTLKPIETDKLLFVTEINLENHTYETYVDKHKILVIEPDFANKIDKKVFEYKIGVFADDESFIAVIPNKNKVLLLTASFKSDKLFLTSWSPDSTEEVRSSFYLPNSNLTEKEEKNYPKEARVKFNKSLKYVSVQRMNETSLVGKESSKLYYTDSCIYITIDIPYSVGIYLIELNLLDNSYKGTNYFVNTYEDNSSSVKSKHRFATGMLYDSVLLIRNTSDKYIQYYFYNIKTGGLLKKNYTTEDDIGVLAHSPLRQKGTWGSPNEEKEFESNKKYLNKADIGIIFPASVGSDSITITNLTIVPTKGILGTALDMTVPLTLGLPSYASALLPPLGPSRDKIIYFHSKFSKKDFLPSNSSSVTTTFDMLLNDKRIEKIDANNSIVIKKRNCYLIGFYSKESHSIEVFKYNVE